MTLVLRYSLLAFFIFCALHTVKAQQELPWETLLEQIAEYIESNYIGEGKYLMPVSACEMMPMVSKCMTLEDMLREEDVGFSQALLELIDQAGKKDSQVYKKANVSRQHFSKIRNNPDYKPTKPTAIAFALALELDLEQTKELIGRAGYALTNSSKFDLIIRFFIEQKNYDITQINLALYEFDQMLLGV